jgi:hypothetical protein
MEISHRIATFCASSDLSGSFISQDTGNIKKIRYEFDEHRLNIAGFFLFQGIPANILSYVAHEPERHASLVACVAGGWNLVVSRLVWLPVALPGHCRSSILSVCLLVSSGKFRKDSSAVLNLLIILLSRD